MMSMMNEKQFEIWETEQKTKHFFFFVCATKVNEKMKKDVTIEQWKDSEIWLNLKEEGAKQNL